MKRAIALVSESAPISSGFESEFEVIRLPADDMIDIPVASHPDMICTVIGDNIIFPRYYAEKYCRVVTQISMLSGYNIVLSHAQRDKVYPMDVSFNTAVIEDSVKGKILLCRKESTAEEILEFADRYGMTVLNTKQGYAGCSCLVCGEHVYTSDVGINKLLTQFGIKSTYIEESITLEGYNCGFIGGCGGYFDGKAYIYGKIHGRTLSCETVCLTPGALTDYGGIKFIPFADNYNK
jgi:hypothetical protein